MSSYANHQALAGLTLGKSTDYRDTYDASLLQGVPRSLNRDPLGLKADTLPRYGYLDAVYVVYADVGVGDAL